MYQLIDGKCIANELLHTLKKEIQLLQQKPNLVVVIVGNDPASEVYVRNKAKKAMEVGIESSTIRLSEQTTEKELLELIDRLNADKLVNGILVQLPLPKHINSELIKEAILPTKDVDGFHPYNIGKLSSKNQGMIACTPRGIIHMLKHDHIQLEGKNVVVIGRSQIVGQPVAQLLVNENATVTITHSKTTNLKEICQKADILIVAIGQPEWVDHTYIKQGAIIIDVGIHKVNGKIVGDCHFESVSTKASHISPVPGGVGPMTIAMLLQNTYDAFLKGR